jgi:hypothetical protein
MHTKEVKNSINSLYQDRLLAEFYIHKLNSDLFRIKEQAAHGALSDHSKYMQYVNSINATLADYRKTKFTKYETEVLSQFQTTVNAYSNDLKLNTIASDAWIEKAIQLTDVLSTIQIEESRNIMMKSDNLYRNSEVSNKLSFSITIIILLVLQSIVIASQTIIKKSEIIQPSLN